MKRILRKRCEKLIPIAWCVFFISLFLPLQTQIYENRSFWNGNFDPFQTFFWPASFYFLALAFLGASLVFFTGKKRKSGNPILALLWTGILFWGSITVIQHGVSVPALSFLFLWLVAGMIYMVIVANIISFRQIALVFMWMAALQTFLALVQTLPGFLSPVDFAVGEPVLRSNAGEILRASGTLGHPNVLGFFLTTAFFLAEFLGTEWKKWRYVFIIGILCTFSRSALLSLAAGTGVLLWKNLKATEGKTARSHIISSFLVFALCGFGFFMRYFYDTLSVSNSERISELPVAVSLLKDNWLWGVGIGNFPSSLATFDTFFPWQLQPVHNLFLLAGSEMGVMALLLFAAMFLLVWKQVLRIEKTGSNVFENTIIGIFMTICVFAVFEHLLLTSVIGIVFLGIFGGLLCQESK